MRVAIVIPARMASTRFPGKPLVSLAGKPMIEWVYRASVESEVADQVVIATPDQEIVEVCRTIGAPVELTRRDHPSGTDRIAEVAERIGAHLYVNVQGDEPLVPPQSIRDCVRPLLEDPSVEMSTLYEDCPPEDEDNPAVVKVVAALNGDALYFSRCSIPFPRNPRGTLKRHVGMYAYTGDVLRRFQGWAPSPLELAEGLEQLRFLENGVRIRLSKTQGRSIGVDTPEQAAEAERLLRAKMVS
jgi:3-deoxy-manno-octulosonate cytidylyltransferase (CMP-KDO synthetase)